jgi:hypothetical protein
MLAQVRRRLRRLSLASSTPRSWSPRSPSQSMVASAIWMSSCAAITRSSTACRSSVRRVGLRVVASSARAGAAPIDSATRRTRGE